MTENRTRRQQIVELLRSSEWAFDDLRRDRGLTVKVLEEDLQHIERSVRAASARLHVRSASCAGCGFEFTKKSFHPPGRCPRCRDRRIDGPWLRITG